jgi:hypothetical protein
MTGARLAVTVVGVAIGAGAPTQSRLSRYPTRTAPAVLVHAHTRLQQLSAATSLLAAAGEPLPRIGVDAVGGRAGPCAERAAGHDVDGHGQWRR